MGGHEFEYGNDTKIYWGDNTATFTKYTIIPRVTSYGVITDIDMFDLDGDSANELVITRGGGHDNYIHFYNGWYIQVITLKNKIATDASTTFIENNKYLPAVPDNQQWIPWLRVGDVDNNGKPDLFSVRCSPIQAVRWELQNKKLIRIY